MGKSDKQRVESDALGEVKVPQKVYRGSYTQRVLELYPQSAYAAIPEEFLRTYIEVKRVYAGVNKSSGKISGKQATAIRKVGKELLKISDSDEFMSYFPISRMQSGGGTSTNMMINETLANLAEEELGGELGTYDMVHPHDHCNASQSSNDTFPGTLKLTVLKLLPDLLENIDVCVKTLDKHAKRWKKVKKVGRTHLQDAVVITVGDELSAYAHTLKKNKKSLYYAGKQLHEINFGGTATGSKQNITDRIRKSLIKAFSKFYKKKYGFPLKQPKNYFEQNSTSSDIARFMDALVHCANDLVKICNDLRLLVSGPFAGMHEYSIPSVQPGSSIMPGKVNPSILEAVTMNCAEIVGNGQTIQMLTRHAQLQLQQFNPQIAWSVLDSVELLYDSLDILEKKCLAGLEINEKHLAKILDNSFATATNLSEKYGYDRVAQAVTKAIKEEKKFKEILEEE